MYIISAGERREDKRVVEVSLVVVTDALTVTNSHEV